MIDEGETPVQGSRMAVKWGLGALALVGAVGAGIAIGNSSGDVSWSNSSAEPADEAPAPVAATPAAKPLTDPTSLVRGVIQPATEATISSKMTARIVAMPFGQGSSFGRGAMLAQFDCSQLKAQLNAANAAATAYRKSYETNVELDQYQAVGKNEVAVSQANLGKATAEAKAIEAQLSDCAVYAPFAGKVVEEIAHKGETAASGQPLLKIQSGGTMEVELIIPSSWLTWVRPKETFAFKIDETGATIKGSIARLGAAVDPVSKTIRVTGSISQSEGLVLPGMSGTASFDNPAASGKPAPAAASTPASNPGPAKAASGQ